MNPLEYPLLIDEGVHHEVVDFLTKQGCNIKTAMDNGLFGQSDLTLLKRAYVDNRVILTHDSDFETLTTIQSIPFIGLIYLRPRYLAPQAIIEVLQLVADEIPYTCPPFVVVADYTQTHPRVRLRQLQHT